MSPYCSYVVSVVKVFIMKAARRQWPAVDIASRTVYYEVGTIYTCITKVIHGKLFREL